MRAFVLSAVAAIGLVIAAAPASAQFGVYVGPNGGAGVYVNPNPHPKPYYGGGGYDGWRISRHEAVRIARRNGMEEVWDVDRAGPYWIVRGVNWKGRKVSMRIHRDGNWGWY